MESKCIVKMIAQTFRSGVTAGGNPSPPEDDRAACMASDGEGSAREPLMRIEQVEQDGTSRHDLIRFDPSPRQGRPAPAVFRRIPGPSSEPISHEATAAADPGLAVEAGEVFLDRLRTDVQAARDLFVA
jgi:hypothetical protein